MSTPAVAVVVHLPALGAVLGPSQLTVQVENTSEADAPAIVIARLVVDAPALDLSSAMTLQFDVPFRSHTEGLTVSAALKSGDPPVNLITTSVVPVRPGQPAHVHLVKYP